MFLSSSSLKFFYLSSLRFAKSYLKPLSLRCHSDAPSILPGLFCSTENGTLQCVCQAEAKPNAVISWTVDGSGALFPHFSNMTHHNGSVTVSELRGLLGHRVTCTAKNRVGTAVTQIFVSSEGSGLKTYTNNNLMSLIMISVSFNFFFKGTIQ